MDSHQLITAINQSALKPQVADVRVGETIKVHYRIREGGKERIQVFAGLVIATKSGRSLQGSFTVRKVVSGIGVERTFPLHSPWIIKIERVKSGKVRRAKLNFVRRYALSSRFKLKDKGLAGTIWADAAKEKEEIAKEAEVHEATEVVAETTPSKETPTDTEASVEEPVKTNDTPHNDSSTTEPVSDESQTGDGATAEKETPDSGA